MPTTTESSFQVEAPPIIEAIIDIDCDLQADSDFDRLQANAREALRERYPKLRRRFLRQHELKQEQRGEHKLDVQDGLKALQFCSLDENQLVQFRPGGYSFNRLAPYSSLDDYLPEIERTWEVFRDLAKPLNIRKVALRTINRIELPLTEGSLELDEFLATAPQLPLCHGLQSLGFFNQHMAVDPSTGQQVNILMATQPPMNQTLPLVLDIDAFSANPLPHLHWNDILSVIVSLRRLKNDVFKSILTAKCLRLFSHQQQ